MSTSHPYSTLLSRASPPEVLFAADIATLLSIEFDQADRQARAGKFGPAFFVHGRVAVLRDDLLQVLRLRAAAQATDDREVMP